MEQDLDRRIRTDEAVNDIGRKLNRHVKLVEEMTMTEEIHVLITDDTNWHENIKTTTRRISVYRGQVQIMQDILSTTIVDKSIKKKVMPRD
jgi:hypothetical protein